MVISAVLGNEYTKVAPSIIFCPTSGTHLTLGEMLGWLLYAGPFQSCRRMMMAFIVSVIFILKCDVSVSTPVSKGEEKAVWTRVEQMCLINSERHPRVCTWTCCSLPGFLGAPGYVEPQCGACRSVSTAVRPLPLESLVCPLLGKRLWLDGLSSRFYFLMNSFGS